MPLNTPNKASATKLLADPITAESTILSFDVESNGLHGEAFAVGAVLIKANETIIDEFTGRSPITGQVDVWVKENVLPVITDMPEDYPDTKALRTAFWQWYKGAKAAADYILVNNGYPSEARFLIASQDDDLNDRADEHPFPLLELGSLLLQVGVRPLAPKKLFVAEKLKGNTDQQHHPRYDAWVAALAAIKALKLSGRLAD